MTGNPPVDVQEYGQSIWLDFISRNALTSGELQTFIDEYGVLGVTSNPSIFQKAISGSDDYDDEITTMLDLDPYDIYEKLAVADIQSAADLLRPIYDRTGRRDGYVSLEVSPLLAQDTDATVAEAQRLHATVDRPNLLIKIPATAAGIPAIEQTIAAGVNVNVTLIFAVNNYIEVAEAYIRGLERLVESGGDPSKIASVASFFLSRIDAMVDRMLENNIRAAQTRRDLDRVSANRRLLGQAAISNAKVAYKRFLDIFYGERFAKLRDAGATPQRVLWASTSTKNPAYSDTMYLDNLIGSDTVNTVPPDTLKAFKDHGKVDATLERNLDDGEVMLDMLAEVGVDFDQVTQQLQIDGVELFAESFRDLLNHVDAKRNVLRSGVMKRQHYALSTYSVEVHAAIQALDSEYTNQRMWAREASLWKDSAPTINAISGRLGWLDVQNTIDRDRLRKLRDDVQTWGFDHVVLFGMGGSSLAPEVMNHTFGDQPGFPKFIVLDSTVPEAIHAVDEAIDPEKTLFIVSSKSGTTLETWALYRYFFPKTGSNGDNFIAITDPDTEVAKLAEENNFRDIFLNPPDIGGRYSALSYFGLVPAALMGLDLDAMWESADGMFRALGENIPTQYHPSLILGAVMGTLGTHMRDKVCIHCTSSIASFGNWLEQLIAESTGKENVGLVPVVGTTVGMPHDYASDRQLYYLRMDDDDNVEEMDKNIRILREAGHPRATFYLPDKYAIAGEFMRWEYATAVAGKILDINPFDEPNVTESKENTRKLLEQYANTGELPSTRAVISYDKVTLHTDEQVIAPLRELCRNHGYDEGDLSSILAAQINSTRFGDYFVLLAYLPATPDIDAELRDIARRLRHITKRAATVGYGPRYLHSTGQLHKGGHNKGIFIQITYEDPMDIEIPGAGYSFRVLKDAQAAGDLLSLQEHKRRAMRLHINGDTKDVVEQMALVQRALNLAEERFLR